jgi:hypothetical protein
MKSEKLLENHYVYVLSVLLARPMTINQIHDTVKADSFEDFICDAYAVRRIIIALSNMACIHKEVLRSPDGNKELNEYSLTLKGAKAIKNAITSSRVIQDRLEKSLAFRKEVGNLDQIAGEVYSEDHVSPC